MSIVFPFLTISVYYGGTTGAERGSALNIPLILPLLLLLVCRLMHCFDLVLQHGKTTDGYSSRGIRTRHLDKVKREKVQMRWPTRYELCERVYLLLHYSM